MRVEWKTCFRIGISIFLLYLGIHYFPTVAGVISALIGAAAPLVVGCVIAYLVNILMSVYEKWYFPKSKRKVLCQSRRPVCMLAAVVTLIAVIALIVGLVLPELISCVRLIITKIPDGMKIVVGFLDRWDILPENILSRLKEIDWQSRIGQIIDVLTSGIGNVMDVVISTVSTMFSGIVTAFIGIIFAVYLLSCKDTIGCQLKRLMKRYLKGGWYGRTVHTVSVLNECFRRYIIGQCTEAVILGLLCTLGMLILRLPYATMIGALIAFTALIPIAGAYIGTLVGAFMILTVSPFKALIFLIFILILQQLEGNLIYPKVVGSSLGLPGIWVLAAVTVGGGMMGVLGMLLGVPLAATVYRLLGEDLRRAEAEKVCPAQPSCGDL